MSNDELLTYEQVRAAIGHGRSHLLLGNGFSISCDSRFNYGSLFDFAKANGLTERVLGVFARLGTNNFEGVMRLLEDTDWLARHYGLLSGSAEVVSAMQEDLQSVKVALVAALARTHLEHTGKVDEDRKTRCASFLEPYHNVFTTNYDLLLYWVEMHALSVLQGRDGFDCDIDEPDAPYVIFSEHVGGDKGIFFIHGALHLYVVGLHGADHVSALSQDGRRAEQASLQPFAHRTGQVWLGKSAQARGRRARSPLSAYPRRTWQTAGDAGRNLQEGPARNSEPGHAATADRRSDRRGKMVEHGRRREG